MTDEAKTQDWGEAFWYRGKVTRRRLIGYTSAAAGALGATMLVPAPWQAAFGQAKPYKIGTEQPLSGAGAAGGKTAVVGVQMAGPRICTPTSAVLPPAAPAPESGCSVPILYGLAWPNAACHGAGTSTVAPSAPAAAEVYPISLRRVTLPRYQNASPQSCVFASSVIVGSSQVGCNGADTRHDNCHYPSARRTAHDHASLGQEMS